MMAKSYARVLSCFDYVSLLDYAYQVYFFFKHSINACAHNARTLIPVNAHMHTLSL